MEYKRLVLVAKEWKEEFDEATGTLYLRATPGNAANSCETLVDPTPGTDPMQYIYRCRAIGCEGRCSLQTVTVSGGTLCFCRCEDRSSPLAASKAKSSMKNGTKQKKPNMRTKKR